MVTDIDHRDVGSLVSNLRRKAAIARAEILAMGPLSPRIVRLEARIEALEDAARIVERWARRRGLRRPLR